MFFYKSFVFFSYQCYNIYSGEILFFLRKNAGEGEILFNNEVIASPSKKVNRENKRKIAMIFQSFNLLQQVDVLKNVEFALEINNIPNKKGGYDYVI